jgi:hypothetical protein
LTERDASVVETAKRYVPKFSNLSQKLTGNPALLKNIEKETWEKANSEMT